MPEVAVGGIQLHYVERPGTGESIVFAHGHHGTHHAWDDLIAALQAPYRALAFDLRGCGGSDRPADGFTSTDYAGDLMRAADALALPPFSLVGYSLGGVAAVQAALDRPGRIRRLVLGGRGRAGRNPARAAAARASTRSARTAPSGVGEHDGATAERGAG